MGAHEEAFYQDFRVRRTVSGQRQRGCVDLHRAWHDLRWRCNAMTGHLLQFENVEISATATHRADRSGGLHLSSSIGEAAHSSRCTLQTFFPHSSTPVTPRYSRPHPISWTIPWLPTLHLPLSSICISLDLLCPCTSSLTTKSYLAKSAYAAMSHILIHKACKAPTPLSLHSQCWA